MSPVAGTASPQLVCRRMSNVQPVMKRELAQRLRILETKLSADVVAMLAMIRAFKHAAAQKRAAIRLTECLRDAP